MCPEAARTPVADRIRALSPEGNCLRGGNGTPGQVPLPLVSPGLLRFRMETSYSSIGRRRTYQPDGSLKRKGGLYVEAMLLARDYAALVGMDPDELVPMVPGQILHAWRRTFATVLDGLGWGKRTVGDLMDLDRHVNFIGNWTVTGGGIREERYVPIDPRLLLAAVEFKSASEVLRAKGEYTAKSVHDVLSSTLPPPHLPEDPNV